jgi:brefeldin A-resistance guanine nucleotide exchange factor 1
MPSAKMAPMIIARNSNNTPINANGDKPKKPQQLQSTSYENGVDPSHQPSLKPAPRSINHTKPPMPESSSASAPVGRRPVPARRHVPPRATSSNSLPGSVASALLIQPNNVCRVIKGEIHNVLNVLRADSRYVSPLRFMEEIPSDEQHPLLLQLREIHATLSEWELLNHQQQPEARMYLPPFCSAIQGRDISASVTGAALNAIHKFLLYGFLSFEGPEAFATIANTLLLCTFEESEDATPASGPRQRNLNSVTDNRDDEQVVLKLLDLSALVVRCASQSLEAELIVGLLDTCLHVSHRAKRASPLLKSAASDALGQIVLQVFSQGDNMVHAREAILANLASLLNPQQNSESYVVNSLTLVNIALETLRVELSPNEITILSNDLCKYLLHWSTTHDLVILSLTLRVIFNLFQTIRNHLKVPLEVFLTSVHLRILEHSASNEEREVALESLLEFCQEPALMKDLYLNYDCDVQCTNLYESICATLGNVAAPNSFCVPQVQLEMDNSLKDGPIAKTAIAQKAAAAAAEVPLNALNILALEGLTTIISSIARRCNNKNNSEAGSVSSGGESVDDDLVGEQVTEEDLQERKRKKFALTKIAKAFNSNPTGKDWLKLGKDLSILDETAECIAKMLHTAPGIDKNQIGLYLAKGPAEKYPFEHEVRVAFVKEYDFKGMHFAQALRLYLSKFRMPGEAQCIDRFMDSFSRELYRQQAEESVFKNSDAIFVLAFSTIMLNTDLHNPTIKNVSRMTCVQFIRNNRGLNNGEDLPEDMLKGLYTSIKESEIQLQRDIGEFISHAEPTHRASEMRAAWDDLLSKNVATALFTTVDEARRTMYQAGVHEKDMFLTIAKPAMKALSSAFVRSWDDGTVVDALKGFEQMAKISTYFGLDNLLNEILTFLLNHGRDYINGCISLEYAGIDSGAPINQSPEDDETMSIVDPDSPLPHVLLKVREYLSVDYKRVDISGAAAYRGLLALNMGLKIVRALFPRVREAWPSLIEVLCGLRDARALPAGLADLDDFADSDGNVLPLSPFAKQSQKRMDDFYRGEPGQDSTENQGWLGRIGLFRRGVVQAEEHESETDPMPDKKASNRGELTANSKTLLQIAERADVEKFMQLSPKTRLPIVKQSIVRLLENVDKFPKKDSPTYEQHTAFALELAARALLASRDRAIELLPLFLAKFDSVASKIKGKEELPVPFLVERVVVTILRTSIHLYGVPQVWIFLYVLVLPIAPPLSHSLTLLLSFFLVTGEAKELFVLVISSPQRYFCSTYCG